MANEIADRRDIDFVLHEQIGVADLAGHDEFQEFNRKTVDMIVTEARNLAIKELLPTRKPGDEEGCTFENGSVKVPQCFHKAYELLCEGEWIAMTDDPAWGGQGMPSTVALAVSNYLVGANFPLMMYQSLTHGAGKLIEEFGTAQQKELFLKKIYTGEWGGTMLLTEPEAGSEVGALTTTATKNDDGTYSITGNKIFISSGEHNMVENIIHPVLARIEGAPPGSKGISLFLVPKIRVNDDGSLGEFNDVVCTGIEEKMGIHGNATCSLTLGGKGRCKGTLLGRENKGMQAMFVMMNEARLTVGIQAFSVASDSYLNALAYARERIQGRHLLHSADHAAPGVPIIRHPDVRRMLLTMKSYVAGMRSLIFFIGYCEDRVKVSTDEKTREKYQGLIDVLIPVAKGYVSDKAFEVCSHGVQIYGGYGYIKEYPQEQLLRDCRITQLYEGTNGIQAMDLLGRKLTLNRGRAMADLLAEIETVVAQAKNSPQTEGLARELEAVLDQYKGLSAQMAKTASSQKILHAFAFAHPFLEVTGELILAWLLLWRATVAARQLSGGAKKKDILFYEGQLHSARFFIHTVLPGVLGKMNGISTMDETIVEMDENSF